MDSKNCSWVKTHIILTLLGSLSVAPLSRGQTPEDMGAITGSWVARIGESELFVFTFAIDHEGALIGSADAYYNTSKLPSISLCELSFNPPQIRFVANPDANVSFEGRFEGTTLIGELLYENGSNLSVELTRFSDSQLAAELPGLLNLFTSVYSYTRPGQTDDGWETATIEDVGLEQAIIEEMMQRINDGEAGTLHSILIVKDGKLVLDAYFDGYYRSDLHQLQSVTKSITSLLIGIAIDQGLIRSLNEKISTFFPTYENVRTDAWDDILLKHILTMSAGIEWDQLSLDTYGTVQDYFKPVFEKNSKRQPGETWEYISPNMNLLSGVIKQVSGLHADAFAERYLFRPLGILTYDWSGLKKNGYPNLTGSLHLRPRDMAKIGLLVLNRGKWNNEQLISSDWIAESTTPGLRIDSTFQYGYLWWYTENPIHNMTVILANGLGSQFIMILPLQNMVVVTTGDNTIEEQFEPLHLIIEYLL